MIISDENPDYNWYYEKKCQQDALFNRPVTCQECGEYRMRVVGYGKFTKVQCITCSCLTLCYRLRRGMNADEAPKFWKIVREDWDNDHACRAQIVESNLIDETQPGYIPISCLPVVEHAGRNRSYKFRRRRKK